MKIWEILDLQKQLFLESGSLVVMWMDLESVITEWSKLEREKKHISYINAYIYEI